MTFVKLLRNPVLSEIQVLREQVLCEPVFLRVQYYYITLLMSSRPCSVFVLVLVLVLQVSRLLGGVIVHRCRPFLVMVYRVSWAWLCPFTEIGLRGFVWGLLGSGIKYVVFGKERLTWLARCLVAHPC